jgi:hypothetical protein
LIEVPPAHESRTARPGSTHRLGDNVEITRTHFYQLDSILRVASPYHYM